MVTTGVAKSAQTEMLRISTSSNSDLSHMQLSDPVLCLSFSKKMSMISMIRPANSSENKCLFFCSLNKLFKPREVYVLGINHDKVCSY